MKRDGITMGLQLLEEIRKVDPEMPAQMITVFLRVAHFPGVTQKELADKVGISQSSVSRNVAALSKVHRMNRPGYDLLFSTEDPAERRRKIVMLTAKGKRVADSIRELGAD